MARVQLQDIGGGSGGNKKWKALNALQPGDRKDTVEMGMRERTGWEMAPRLSAGAGE